MSSNLVLSAGYKALFVKKWSYSIICSALSNLVVIFTYILALNFNINFSKWFKLVFQTTTTFTAWIYILVFTVLILAKIVICAKNYILNVPSPETRFQKFLSMVSPRLLILCLLHIITGGGMVWLYLSISRLDYRYLYVKCEEEKYCLVEENFFMIFGGLWTGFYYFLWINKSEKNILFPMIQQVKLEFSKDNFLSLLRDSKSTSYFPTICYFIFYYFFGQFLSEYFSDYFNLKLRSSFTFQVYFYSWLFSVLYIINMNLIQFFFELYLMEPMEHQIIPQEENDTTLSDAILLNVPILQHLACLDLYLLSTWSTMRRQLLYTISQPGGHPYIWRHLFQCCLNLITNFTETLNSAINIIVDDSLQIINKNELSSNKNFKPQSSLAHCNMRNMSLAGPVIDPIEREQFSRNRFQIFTELYHKITNNRITKYFFGELPQVKIQHCLKNGQIIIWITRGLTNIIVASIREDPYGIVQKDIGTFVNTLLNLKCTLDKLNKLPSGVKKGTINTNDLTFKMKNGLNSAVKRSLCNICKTYENYLSDLSLTRETISQLQPYL